MPREPLIARQIDDLLAAPKTLQGVPRWRDMRQHDEMRIVWPILIADEISSVTYQLKCYPRETRPRFRLLLCAPTVIWRVDFAHGKKHTNSLDKPRDLLEFVVEGPHYHAWSDNRHLCSSKNLPDHLRNARVMPPQVRSFDQAQRWFCGQTNINLEPHHVVELPPSDLLL